MKIGSIVIHCHAFDAMLAFWQGALGYVPRDPFVDGSWVVLTDPKGRGPNISLQRRKTRRDGKRGWMHLDLYTANHAAEAERLIALGARRYPWRYRPNADFIVLEDPEGNLFCVVEKPEPAQ